MLAAAQATAEEALARTAASPVVQRASHVREPREMINSTSTINKGCIMLAAAQATAEKALGRTAASPVVQRASHVREPLVMMK